ncbi:MAG: glycine cleavage system protein GcvH [Candidatus Saganbacteria bacterium]|nr:glycine cleavage system protein GcvH [Candidatus Saganbacteria bacterium]
MFPEELKYSKEHEWVKLEGNVATIGISSYAQEELGDVVFVELPKAGQEYKANDEIGVVESVKTVSTLYCPVSGKVTAINDELSTQSALINQDPYGKGWIAKVEMSNPAEVESLLSAKDYQSQLAG